MTFQITIDVYGKSYRMTVEKISHGDSIEKYKVTAGNKKIVVQNNRPELQKKKSKKPVKWQIVEGDVDITEPKKNSNGHFTHYRSNRAIYHKNLIQYRVLKKKL